MSLIAPILLIFGGLSLFLYAVEETSRFCREVLSGSASSYLLKITASRTGACFFGVLLSALSQSSVVATSFAVGLVDAGLLPYSGAIVVMMGASAGGMIAMFFVSLNVTSWAPLMLTVTTLLTKTTKGKTKKIALLLRAISLIFLGMYLLGMGAAPILQLPVVQDTITRSAGAPLALGAVALFATLVLQSSSAVIALAFTLIASGALSFAESVPIVLGTHLGSSIPVFLASIGGKPNARRLGVLVLLFKIVGVLLLLPIMPLMTVLVARAPLSQGVQLALVANLVPITNTLLLLPFSGYLARVSQRFFQGESEESEAIGSPLYLDSTMLQYPDVALSLLNQEMARLSTYLQGFMECLFTTKGKGPQIDAYVRGLPELGKACMRYLRALSVDVGSQTSLHYEGLLYTLLGLRNLSRVLRKELLPVVTIRQEQTPPLAEREEWASIVPLIQKVSHRVLFAFREKPAWEKLPIEKLQIMEGTYAKLERAFEEELLLKKIATASSKDLETLVALSNILKSLMEIYKGSSIFHSAEHLTGDELDSVLKTSDEEGLQNLE